jgi:excisionase family DNA binding protein
MDPIHDRHVYLLDDSERQLIQGGPALIAPDGTRHDIPVRVYEALLEVEQVLRSGKAIQLNALDTEVSIGEAAELIRMHPDTLLKYVQDGTIPSRKTGIVVWVPLADVLEFDRRLMEQRAAAMQEMANEEPWPEDSDTDTDSVR